MSRIVSKGKCSFCGGIFDKEKMARHIESCRQREAVSKAPLERRGARRVKTFHLLVEGRYLPEYWMHLEVDANATLEDLDRFLRDTWLECCNHLSAFTVKGRTYLSDIFEEGEEDMDVKLGYVLRPGVKLLHEYDFGTTTELTLRVISESVGELRGGPIQILARNEPPSITCNSCGKTATLVCCICIDEGDGWLCDECARDHKCGEEMLLPVVNSPRVGMCGYTGPG
jgi:hypothetical protein